MSLGLSYKIYLLSFNSNLRKAALQIVTIHSSYNQFLRDNQTSSVELAQKITARGEFFSENPLYLDGNDLETFNDFWANFLNSENSRKLISELNQNEGQAAYFPINFFGGPLKLYISRNERIEDSDQLIIGLVVADRHGYMLDKLIDDASPMSGIIQLKQMISNNSLDVPNQCSQVGLVQNFTKNSVACGYVYLF